MEKSYKGNERRKMHMERRTFLWIVIAVLFFAVLLMSFKAGVAGSSVEIASTVAQSASSSAMVGGC